MECHAKNCVYPKSKCGCRELTLKEICGRPDAKVATIKEMVDYYKKHLKKPTEEWLKSLTLNQPEDLWFTNFICGEANISNFPEDGKFCKNSHQYRMPSSTIKNVREVLKKVDLDRLSTFRDIFEAVRKATDKTDSFKGVDNFGILACYDFSVRYAFQRGITPDVVYLHAGTNIGLNALKSMFPGIKTKKDYKFGETIEASLLPYPISTLENLHIEHFLCIFHDHLMNLANHN